jgi:hypothetical protein
MLSSPAPCFTRVVLLAGFALAALAMGGCSSMFHTAAVVGPDLQPHATAAISIPFGK